MRSYGWGTAAANPSVLPPPSGMKGWRARSTGMSAMNAAPACVVPSAPSTPSPNLPTPSSTHGRCAGISAIRSRYIQAPASPAAGRRNRSRMMLPSGAVSANIAIELGRPTLGVPLREPQKKKKVTRARAGIHKIERNNPIHSILADAETVSLCCCPMCWVRISLTCKPRFPHTRRAQK